MKDDRCLLDKEESTSVPESGNGVCKVPEDQICFSIAARDHRACSPFHIAEVSFTSSLEWLEFPKPSTGIAIVDVKRKQQICKALMNMGRRFSVRDY